MIVVDEGVAAAMGVVVVWLVGAGLKPAPTPGWLHGWRGLGVVVVAWPRAAPGPHPNPLPSNGRGGMFVADEGVAAAMGVVVVQRFGGERVCWWFGR